MELKDGSVIEMTAGEKEQLVGLFDLKKRLISTLEMINKTKGLLISSFRTAEDDFFEPLAKRLGIENEDWSIDVDEKTLEMKIVAREEANDLDIGELVSKIKESFGGEIKIIRTSELTDDDFFNSVRVKKE